MIQPQSTQSAPSTERAARAPFDRYLVVTIVATPTSFGLFGLALAMTGWSPAVANLVVASVVAIPSFLACKRWVWQSTTAITLRREVGPYWMSTLINVFAATVTVDRIAAVDPPRWVLTAVPTAVYTLTWICRFLLLDRYVFRSKRTTAWER